MALSIIERRLVKLLKLNNYTSKFNRAKKPGTVRRSSYSRGSGARELTESAHFLMDTKLALRLLSFCELHQVAKGLVLRDALDFYLGIAEQEGIPFLESEVAPQAKANHVKRQREYRAELKQKLQQEGEAEEAGTAVKG